MLSESLRAKVFFLMWFTDVGFPIPSGNTGDRVKIGELIGDDGEMSADWGLANGASASSEGLLAPDKARVPDEEGFVGDGLTDGMEPADTSSSAPEISGVAL